MRRANTRGASLTPRRYQLHHSPRVQIVGDSNFVTGVMVMIFGRGSLRPHFLKGWTLLSDGEAMIRDVTQQWRRVTRMQFGDVEDKAVWRVYTA